MTANIPKMLRLIIVFLTTYTTLNAQPYEEVLSCLPYELRPIRSMDATASLTPVMVMVGDGIVRTVPGGSFVDMSDRYRDVLFSHIAAFDDTIALAATATGSIHAIDIVNRQEVTISNLPRFGRGVFRCDAYAIIPVDSLLLRCSMRERTLHIDTLQLGGIIPHHTSAADGSHCVVIDTAANILAVVNITADSVVSTRSYRDNPAYIQALSRELTYAFIPRWGGFDAKIAWNMRDSLLPVAGDVVTAQLNASRYGGGAVITEGHMRFAYGDSHRFVRVNKQIPLFTSATAGVAWWYRQDTLPGWWFTGSGVAMGRIEDDGHTPTDSESYQFARQLNTSTRSWSHLASAGSTLIAAALGSPSATSSNVLTTLGISRDNGNTWVLRDVQSRGTLLSLSTNDQARILFATKDSLTLLDNPFALATTVFTSAQSGTPIIGASFTERQIVVLADSIYIREYASDAWQTRPLPTATPGRFIYTRGDTLVQHVRDSAWITVDAGITWRGVPIRTNATITSCVVNTDTSFACAWILNNIGAVSTSNGRIIPLSFQGELIRLNDNAVYYASSNRALQIDVKSSQRLPGTFLTTNPLEGANPARIQHAEQIVVADNGLGHAYIIDGSMMKRITQTPPTSVPAERESSATTVWPTPASDVLHGVRGVVHVRTLDGTLVATHTADDTGSIDVSALRQGVYVLTMNAAGNHHTALIVIQR